ncbi:MAG: imidazole glycerol phosphate synthase subunit HisH, partial [Candidatus Omnitrophica bacterium]|nr:imidazole glycerol phosphate synthase subunit HisH [Candidatus Omnitrophota bacterium]
MIAIVDYGMGNLRSVSKALEHLGATAQVTGDPHTIQRADKLILPGVGAFPAAMRELQARGLVEPIKEAIAGGKPYLGICLGLQLLFEHSEEGNGANGLGILSGVVRRFSFEHSAFRIPHSALKIPHMGWNQVARKQGAGSREQGDCPLLQGIPEGS